MGRRKLPESGACPEIRGQDQMSASRFAAGSGTEDSIYVTTLFLSMLENVYELET